MKDKLGFVGTLFAFLCCFGLPIVVAPLTAIGLGFLIHDLILFPLAIIFSLITVWGLHEGWKRHGDRRPFFVGLIAAVVLVPSFFATAYLAVGFLALLLIATIWNTMAVYRARQA